MDGIDCGCRLARHESRLVVLTGGPGAGKTAVLEVVRRHFCEHVVVLPEAASILFKGGFPRKETPEGLRATQRTIFRVQIELERLAQEEGKAAVVLCDRGTVDGLAYWPGEASVFWGELGTSREEQLKRYATVIHLRTPSATHGYNHDNPQRQESARRAMHLDRRIEQAWAGHPDHHFVGSETDFIVKIEKTLALIRARVPECCRTAREAEKAAPAQP
ncbi:MAG TPA: ATP-binding protein [Holophagaceae bacterium]|nr:ATP-binding protein [Holophagaceae bacterium]